MSNSSAYGERRGWRYRNTQSGNRWTARIFISCLAFISLAILLFILSRPRPNPQLHVLLLDPGSPDRDVLPPSLFAATATKRITDELKATRIQGTAKSIEDEISGAITLSQFLDDPDDTTLVIVRGYLLRSESGEPMIACSDLSAISGDKSRSDAEIGQFPLKRLLEPLAAQGPESFHGNRIVVLDVEPLAAVPRLNQYNDSALETLADCVEKLEGPHKNRVWVCVLRPPLENVGWDPKSKMPISTQTLLDGLRGEANFDNGYEVTLDELCKFIVLRYESLAQGSHLQPPRISLLRGGYGPIEDLSDIPPNLWVSKPSPPAKNDVDTQNNVPKEAPPETKESPEKSVVYERSLSLTPVRYQADPDPSDSPTPSAGAVAVDKAAAVPGSNEAEQTGIGPAETAKTQTEGEAVSEGAKSDFWQLRDELEKNTASGRPHPIAVAPHLWRKCVLEVLGAEIEAMDPAPESSSGKLIEYTTELRKLMKALEANNTSPVLPESGVVGEIASRWDKACRQQSNPDDQQQVANDLQRLIAISYVKLADRLEYRHRALLAKSPSLSDDSDLRNALRSPEQLLAKSDDREIDVPAFKKAIETLQSKHASLDSGVDQSLEELLDQFKKADSGKSWHVIRQAYAWLLSPLPSGEKRRKLLEALNACELPKPDAETLRYQPQLSRLNHLQVLDEPSRLVKNLKTDLEGFAFSDPLPLNETDGVFGKQFAAALRTDPFDKSLGRLSEPILHGVQSAPRKRDLAIKFLDSSLKEVGDSIDLQSHEGELVVRISPDSDLPTKFEIQAKIESPVNSLLSIRWPRSDSPISIPPRQSKDVKLQLIFDDRKRDIQAEKISIHVKPIDINTDPELASLERSKSLRIRPPQEDQIRLAVGTVGLSKKIVSGDDTLPDGVWLKGFPSRRTRFQLYLFNEADRATRVRVWLLKLRNPLEGKNIAAYRPELLAKHKDRLESQFWLNADGRVDDAILSGELRLKGPVDISLPSQKKQLPIDWKAVAAAADDKEAKLDAAPASAASTADDDVTHGFALIVRRLDDQGNSAPGDDQRIWMIPKPWHPESYIDVEPTFRDAEVHVKFAIKQKIDGDDIPDRIPNIDEEPISIRWQPDDQWEGFQRNSPQPPVLQETRLQPGRDETMKVLVPENRRETVVRLDVDGWPRAFQRMRLVGGLQVKLPRVDFGSVSMDYGDVATKWGVDDQPLEKVSNIYSPTNIVFRGRGKRLTTNLQADLPALSTSGEGEDGIPSVRLSVDGVDRIYWTDRLVKTIASAITDDGHLDLLTTVEDLHETWTTQANQSDAIVKFKADVVSNREILDSKELVVKLDSTPPEVDLPRLQKLKTNYYVGEPLLWDIRAKDVVRNGVATGVARIAIGTDAKRIKKLDSEPQVYEPNSQATEMSVPGPYNEVIPEKPGIYRIAVQAWDKVGLASEPKFVEIQVREKPKPVALDASPNPDPNQAMTKPKLGTITGKIDSGHTMRGMLTLSPPGPDIRPDTKIEVANANPTFAFSNVPEGDYKLSFEGTVNNSRKSFLWSGLKLDVEGEKGRKLSLNDAEKDKAMRAQE